MTFSRTHEYEIIRDTSEVFDEYGRLAKEADENTYSDNYAINYIKDRFSDSKTAIQRTVDDFARRAGLVEYINKINAELNSNTKVATTEDRPKSLLDFPDIKEAIDIAINSNKTGTYVDILNKLQETVNVDEKVPEELKGVFLDKILVEYIKNHIGSIQEEVTYDLRQNNSPFSDNRPQTGEAYFNFTSDENRQS